MGRIVNRIGLLISYSLPDNRERHSRTIHNSSLYLYGYLSISLHKPHLIRCRDICHFTFEEDLREIKLNEQGIQKSERQFSSIDDVFGVT